MKEFKRCVSVRLLGLIGVLATSACSTSGGARAPEPSAVETSAPEPSAVETSAPETSAVETSATEKPTPVVAGAPTLSLEAIAINGKSLGDRPKVQIDASPGDIITAEIYVRDWSPDGELLSGYQAALLPVSFSSGERGFIEPVQYEALQKTGEENTDNSFVDDRHPRFVHSGLNTLSLPDTRSEGYRWLSLVVQGTPPKCAQDGKRFYCATIKFEVSKNAEGTFTLELNSHPDFSMLRKADASPIDGVKFEPLKIKIR